MATKAALEHIEETLLAYKTLLVTTADPDEVRPYGGSYELRQNYVSGQPTLNTFLINRDADDWLREENAFVFELLTTAAKCDYSPPIRHHSVHLSAVSIAAKLTLCDRFLRGVRLLATAELPDGVNVLDRLMDAAKAGRPQLPVVLRGDYP